MKKIVIIGAGGHGKVVLDILENIKRESFDDIEIVGFLDDGETGNVHGYKIIGKTNFIQELSDNDTYFIIAIGSNSIRKVISEKYHDINWYTAIDPSAIISAKVLIKEGTVVMPRAVINIDAEVGMHSIINTGAIVEHDCIIKDFVHVSPGALITGGCKIDNLVHIGAGAVLNPLVEVCSHTVVGSGAIVIKNLDISGIYVGIPSKKIKSLE